MITRSAHSSWSSNTSSSGLSWSSEESSARCRAIASGSSAKRPAATAAPSTTAITPSTVTREAISGQLKAFTSGLGSARPEVSMTMCSGGDGRSSRLFSAGTKSSATVQHRQPLASSTMASSGQLSTPQLFRISPSMPTSPNSLTITASRRPPAFSSTCRTSVVLPAPRKPVTIVQGTLATLMTAPGRWCGGFHRRHAGDGVLADMLGTVAPLRHALCMRPVQAGKIDDVAGMPIGIEVADHVGPLAGRRHGRTAAARAVRQAVGRHHGDPLVAVGAEPLLDRRQQTRARTLSIRGVRRDGRVAATGDADIENGGRHVRRGLPPPPWRCRPPAPPARPRP